MKQQTTTLMTQSADEVFNRFSSFTKLHRVITYCLRFIKNCKRNSQRQTGWLSNQELKASMITLVKRVQQQEFLDEINSIKTQKQIKTNSSLKSLNPFVDSHGLLRVGGRLNEAWYITYNYKHPIILPSKHKFTELIIHYEHIRNLHAGIQGTLSSIRQQFWPLKGKQTVKKIIRQCIKCFRHKPSSFNPQMGNLPQDRLTPTRPFNVSGLDYAGPFQIKENKFRNRKFTKGYICIFVCLATKAIHLELVSDLSTDCFINALQRFISRRGVCSKLMSDNASNFVGAKNELREIERILQHERINTYFTSKNIEWKFIPAHSPHMGGLWESVVKSVKYHLKRTLHTTKLTYEEFYTTLTQIEAVLNSRPLVPLSEDANELEALTPGHFLIGDALTSIPQVLHPEKVNFTHVKRYKHLQRITQQFWKRWKQTYLHELQERTKWRFNKSTTELIGAIVYLKDENSPPLQWPIGRILAVHPGKDNIIRVVTVKTRNGVTKRAISRVCLLPITQE